MAEEDQTVVAVVTLKFDMPHHRSKLTSTQVKPIAKEYDIPLDLHPKAPPEGATMDQLPEDAIAITMSEYLRFPFTSNVVVQKGTVMPAKENIVLHTTPLLLENQDILEKTDKSKKQADGDEGSSKPKSKRRKTQVVRKGQTASSSATTSQVPIWVASPADHSLVVHSESEEEKADEPLRRLFPRSSPQNAPENENNDVHVSSHESVDEFVHNYIDVDASQWGRKLPE
ncbi:hypothetical protein Tco_0955889 [Tanacetum coccineum]|uniref:Coilin n=1 Tax=Tanacetum coccineum TaxID=301880 RepID=A0ABQ5E8F7_9ASTR